MNVFIFGAGASQGALGSQAPVASQFGRALEEEIPAWCQEFPSLGYVVDHLGQPLSELGLVEIWTCIDYLRKAARSISASQAVARGIGGFEKGALAIVLVTL
jgi:hypothetical protein